MLRKTWILALSLALTALACAQQQPSPSGPTGGDQPKSGGRLNLRTPGDPNSFDLPLTGTSNINNPLQEKAYESLLGFMSGPDVDYTALKLEPTLAERWEISPDGKTYIFYLRKGVRFHNMPPVNGREFTSADVKFSYEYTARAGDFKSKPTSQYAYLLTGLENIDASDPYIVKVTFQEPFAPFLNYSGSTYLPMYAHEIYEKDGDFTRTLAGVGPFILDKEASQQGARWVMKKNPDYWRKGLPYVDEVRLLVLPDEATTQAAFQTKQIDVHSADKPETRTQMRADNPDAIDVKTTSPAGMHIYMNVFRPPFDDVRVRRAVSLGIDRNEYLKVFGAGEGAWALAGAFPETYTEAEIRQILRYDPEEAKRLLAEAGHPDGIKVELNFTPAFGDKHRQESEILQSQLGKVGIKITLKPGEQSEYLRLTRDKCCYDITSRSKAVLSDVDSYLFSVFHPKGGVEGGGMIADPELTPLIEAQRRETDPVKRKELVRKAVRIVADKAYGLTVYRGPSWSFHQSYVKDYYPAFGSGVRPLIYLWLNK